MLLPAGIFRFRARLTCHSEWMESIFEGVVENITRNFNLLMWDSYLMWILHVFLWNKMCQKLNEKKDLTLQWKLLDSSLHFPFPSELISEYTSTIDVKYHSFFQKAFHESFSRCIARNWNTRTLSLRIKIVVSFKHLGLVPLWHFAT